MRRRRDPCPCWSRSPGIATLDRHDRRSAHAKEVRIGRVDFEPHRKPLSDMDPIQLTLYERYAVREIDLALGLHRPTDTLNRRSESPLGCGEEIHLRERTRRHI